MKSKVLMLLYRFPPMGGSGVQRGLKFVKYLPEYGWDPVVVTAAGRVDISQDRSLESEIPTGIKIIRIPSLEPSLLRPRRNSSSPGPDKVVSLPKVILHYLIRFGRKLKNILAYFLIPDEQIFWSLLIIPVGVWICLTRRVGVVFASARPFSCLLSAAYIGKLCRIPVVMDIRDPLTDGLDYTYRGIRRKIDRALEGNVLRSAMFVTSVNMLLASHYQNHFPSLIRQKFIEIPNGFDEEDFCTVDLHVGNTGEPDPNLSNQQGTLRLLHVGQVYPGATEVLIDILKELRESDPGLFSSISVRLIGGIPLPETDLDFIRASGFEHIISVENRVEHLLALEEMAKADILLILRPIAFDVPHMGAGKIYEYLRTGRPILGLGPDNGVIPQIIHDARIGGYYSKGEERAAVELLRGFANGRIRFLPNWEYVNQFDRRRQTEKLAQLLGNNL